jgi:hypothetical protein
MLNNTSLTAIFFCLDGRKYRFLSVDNYKNCSKTAEMLIDLKNKIVFLLIKKYTPTNKV